VRSSYRCVCSCGAQRVVEEAYGSGQPANVVEKKQYPPLLLQPSKPVIARIAATPLVAVVSAATG